MSDRGGEIVCYLILIGMVIGLVGGCYLIVLGNAAMGPIGGHRLHSPA